MADNFQLEIVTPDKQVVNDVAEEAQVPAKGGYIGILPGHAPLITELGVGEVQEPVRLIDEHEPDGEQPDRQPIEHTENDRPRTHSQRTPSSNRPARGSTSVAWVPSCAVGTNLLV